MNNEAISQQPAPARQFLLTEFMESALQACLQRNPTYRTDASEFARRGVRDGLKNTLRTIGERYRSQVAENDHLANIRQLADGISDKHHPALLDSRLRIGTAQKALNLYLKYLWCADLIPEPPHCPFDQVVISHLRATERVSWTRLDSMQDYIRLIAAARRAAGKQTLARWELMLYNRDRAQS